MPRATARASSTVPLLLLGGAVLLWGTSFVGTKAAQAGLHPMAVVWLRMVIASIAFLPFWRVVPKPDRRPGDWKWLLAFAVFEPCLYFLFESYAIKLTTASQAGVITAIAPLLVAVGARLFLREHLSGRAIAGLAVSLAGVVVLSMGGLRTEDAANPALGNALEVGAMVCAAGYMLVVKHLSHRYDAWWLVGFQNVVGALFFLPGALLSDPASWARASAETWGAVVYLGAFVSLGAFGLYNGAVARMPASRAALAINLIPLVAMATGVVVLRDTVTPVQIAGCVAIAAGVALGQTGPAHPPVEAAVEGVPIESDD